MPLRLLSLQQFPDGVVQLHYEVQRRPSEASQASDRKVRHRLTRSECGINWRNIPITLICPRKGEQTAQACVKACLRQVEKKGELLLVLRTHPCSQKGCDHFESLKKEVHKPDEQQKKGKCGDNAESKQDDAPVRNRHTQQGHEAC